MKNNFVMITFTDIDYWNAFHFAICTAHLQDAIHNCVMRRDSNTLKNVIANLMLCQHLNKSLCFRGENINNKILEVKSYIDRCLSVSFHSKIEDAKSHHDLVFVYDVNLKYFPVTDMLMVFENIGQLEYGF